MALVPYRVGQAVSPYVYRAVNPYLGLLGFNEFSRQGRRAHNNLVRFAHDISNMMPQRLDRVFGSNIARRYRQVWGRSPGGRLRRGSTPRARTPRTVRRTPIRRGRVRRGRMGTRVRGIRGTLPTKARSVRKVGQTAINRILGYRPGTGAATKRTFYGSNFQNVNDKTLYTLPMIKIPWSDNESDGTRRATGAVNCKGVKIVARFKLGTNTAEWTKQPVTLRWALVCNKDSTNGTTNINISDTNFFKEFEDQNQLMNDAAFNTTDTATMADARQINTREFLVIKEGKSLLFRNNNTTANSLALGGSIQQDGYVDINEYIKLSTQVRFEAESDAAGAEYPQDHNIFLVFWLYAMDKQQTDNTPEGVARLMFHNINYFTDAGWHYMRY